MNARSPQQPRANTFSVCRAASVAVRGGVMVGWSAG
jgi:hypothetical protein